jgi:hypothetical protein
MTRLHLNLIDNTFMALRVVESGAWKQLELPRPPNEIVAKGSNAIIQYLVSEDKVPSHAMRMFFIGDSTVKSPPSRPPLLFTDLI